MSTDIDTTADALPASGATFGVAGAVSITASGALLAGVNAALDPASVGESVSGATFGSTDGNATGTYSYSSPAFTEANPGGRTSASVT